MTSFQSELVRVAIAIYLDLKPSEIRRNAHLKRDLGLEPLDVILIVFRLEELTDAEFTMADLRGVETVADLERTFRESTEGSDDDDADLDAPRRDLSASGIRVGPSAIPAKGRVARSH
jgi:acyl carrier protein